MNFNRQELADQAASLAVRGVYIGTSSWKYPGWCGTIYDRARYEYRGEFPEYVSTVMIALAPTAPTQRGECRKGALSSLAPPLPFQQP